jgi:hypothetical protein
MIEDYLLWREEAYHLAQQLLGNAPQKCNTFTNRLIDICARAEGKDFLLIHNPGGWGSTDLEHLLDWERNVVEGIRATIEQQGHSWLLIQYFRSGHNWWAHMRDIKEQTRFFFTGKIFKAEVMAAELKFIAHHLNNLKIILIGASHGAAFSNTVMRQLGEFPQIYSIELGMFFSQISRRVVTERTLAIDNNGQMPDPVVLRNLKAASKTYITAPYRWLKYRLEGKPVKFAYCINVPGHEYDWSYPAVQQQIVDFLGTKFGTKSNLEKSLS